MTLSRITGISGKPLMSVAGHGQTGLRKSIPVFDTLCIRSAETLPAALLSKREISDLYVMGDFL
jgi:hypothetical protein